MRTSQRLSRLACTTLLLLGVTDVVAAAPRTVVVENWTNFQ